MENWLWNLLNVGVSLFGYYFAALSIDWKWWGRKRMQVETATQLPHNCLWWGILGNAATGAEYSCVTSVSV